MSLGSSLLQGVRAAGPREVLVCGPRRLTGDDVLAMVSGAVSALHARGVRQGDPIAVMYGRQPESTVARLVTLALGCPVVKLLPGLPTRVAAETLRALGCSVLLHEPCRQDDADELLDACHLPIEYRLDADLFGTPHCGLVEARGRAPDALSSVTFTNGTTGECKPVAYSERAEAAQLAAARSMFGPAPWRFQVPPGHFLPNQMALWTLSTGGTAVLLSDSELGREAEVAVRERVTHMMSGRPFELYALAGALATARASGADQLRLVIYGGAPAVAARSAEAIEAIGPMALQCYGLTEGGFVSALQPDAHLRPELLSSVGRPVRGVEVRVRDQDGADLPTGEVGEVWVRSPQLMTGYVGDAVRTARALRDGWLRTGDLGRLDAESYLFLVDRVEERLAPGVYARPIENVLTGHPAVADAAVFALPDGSGQVPAGVVVRRDGHEVDLEALRALVRRELGAPCEPRRLWLVDELPRTPGGKPDKAGLRSRYRLVEEEAREERTAAVT
ncbi:class I adenylate-forming enzyme family protein [Nonomuraea dietziae]|uniref:Fatty-acyl-CoA synthase n=1 Tax=Nonomuraea dietziae TaxID=65515 RepID=A0A7W5V8G2_9ACTN|nr:fatty acid--CoA ligase family protein [Nonomuraea dietziae]MBB3732511.1 fatty-acyl-CoA synthase [Nonomuraea dietziae]